VSTAPVVAIHRLPSEVDARVRRACLRAGARVVGSDGLRERGAALLVAHLPRRARRIPADALDVAGRVDSQLPILLACDEALVHPTTTLSLGGVTLVEHAATERLYSQIRIALAAARARAGGEPFVEALEEAGPHWWLSTVRQDPRVVVARSDSLTFLVPLRHVADPAGLLARALEVLGEAGDLSSALAECLRGDAGLVHLTREARSWIMYWPAQVGGLWLFSSHRLPHLSELSRSSDAPRLFRSPASPGEIVVATTRPLGGGSEQIVTELDDGGPVAMDRLRALSLQIDGFVVEVR
jgi:hypothetical protein